MLSSRLYLGLPCDIFVRGFHLNIFLTVLVSGILCIQILKYAKTSQVSEDINLLQKVKSVTFSSYCVPFIFSLSRQVTDNYNCLPFRIQPSSHTATPSTFPSYDPTCSLLCNFGCSCSCFYTAASFPLPWNQIFISSVKLQWKLLLRNTEFSLLSYITFLLLNSVFQSLPTILPWYCAFALLLIPFY
jgi:hypothetical protein